MKVVPRDGDYVVLFENTLTYDLDEYLWHNHHQFKCSKLNRRFMLVFLHLNRRKLALICPVRRKRRRKRTMMKMTSTRADLGDGEGFVTRRYLPSSRISRYFSAHADKISSKELTFFFFFFLSSIFKLLDSKSE